MLLGILGARHRAQYLWKIQSKEGKSFFSICNLRAEGTMNNDNNYCYYPISWFSLLSVS